MFCFDPRLFNTKVQKYGTLKCGLIRARFILETVQNLRKNLEAINSKLLVSIEKPEEFLPKLINDSTTLIYQQEICSEELDVE